MWAWHSGLSELLNITPLYHLPPPGEESEQSLGKVKWTVEGRSLHPDSMSNDGKEHFVGWSGNCMKLLMRPLWRT